VVGRCLRRRHHNACRPQKQTASFGVDAIRGNLFVGRARCTLLAAVEDACRGPHPTGQHGEPTPPRVEKFRGRGAQQVKVMQWKVQVRQGRPWRPRITTCRRSPGAGKADSRKVSGAAKRMLFFYLCEDGIQRGGFRKGALCGAPSAARGSEIAAQIRGITTREMRSKTAGESLICGCFPACVPACGRRRSGTARLTALPRSTFRVRGSRSDPGLRKERRRGINKRRHVRLLFVSRVSSLVTCHSLLVTVFYAEREPSPRSSGNRSRSPGRPA
jgi:hypothetical protein